MQKRPTSLQKRPTSMQKSLAFHLMDTCPPPEAVGVYRALLWRYRALLPTYRALLKPMIPSNSAVENALADVGVCRALLCRYRALLPKDMSL